MNDPDVTLVIVSWNTREMLRHCLQSVYESAGVVDLQIIVVDNASADGSARMVAEEFPRVQLIANTENRGFAAANNQGVALARGRYVLLLNSDTIVLDGVIEKTVAFARTHPEAAVVGCRVLNADRTPQSSCFLFPSALNLLIGALYLNKLFPRSRFWGRERLTWWDGLEARAVDVVTGCFMLVRRDAIAQVGGMDEAFFMYAEEADWCYRFQQAGWAVLFFPGANIIHLGGASSRQAPSKMRLQLAGSILYFLRKHRSRSQYVLGCLLTALFFLVRLPFWSAKGCLSRSDRSHSWRVVKTYATGGIAALRGYRGLCVPEGTRSRGASPPGAAVPRGGMSLPSDARPLD
jgi:GT2 family glycosyltransferase